MTSLLRIFLLELLWFCGQVVHFDASLHGSLVSLSLVIVMELKNALTAVMRLAVVVLNY